MTTPETTLRLIRQPSGTEIPFPANSGTFIDCDLSPIADSAHLARDVNGNLIDLGDSRFRKYALTLSCGGGVQLPALANLWPGMAFTVELPVVLKEPGMTPSRDAVEGSVRLVGGYVEYRPVMSVMLTQNSLQETEWRGRSSGWSLSFEEIDAEFSDAPALPEEMVEATGGTVTDYVDEDGLTWREHDFTASGNFVVSAPGEAQFVAVVAGGGGGGFTLGAGGAGGMISPSARLEIGTYAITIGAGGAGALDGSDGDGRHGRPGSSTSVASLAIAFGGGGGQGATTSGWNSLRHGGSGGGSRYENDGGGNGRFPQGNDGGMSRKPDSRCGAGGGGAGGPGEDATTDGGGNGGLGREVNTSTGKIYLASGGAGADPDFFHGLAHPGGGGDILQDGVQNTGGGGGAGFGGGEGDGSAGNGGSGRVIIRYRIA